MEALPIDDVIFLPASDLSFAAVRASGKGGQNVNKVATKVELRFDLEGTRALRPSQKARLRTLARGRLAADGSLIVVSQKTREQPRNLADAREKLAALVLQALPEPVIRRPSRPTRGSIRRRLNDKRAHSDKKRDRQFTE